MREIILDTETTGLDPKSGHRIIEIGALEMINKVLTGKSFHYYLNPQRDVPFEAFQIHGISTDFLRDKPKFVEIAESFLEFVKGGRLVIHNAGFDLNFLNYELSLLKLPSLDNLAVVDTLQLAKKAFPGARNNLDALCKRFKIDNSHRQFHGALKDAELLSEVYIELTGGRQVKLDISLTSEVELLNAGKGNLDLTTLNFKTSPPTAEEIALHQEFIKKIPNNLWPS